jgi:hypothetical protein
MIFPMEVVVAGDIATALVVCVVVIVVGWLLVTVISRH